MKKIYVCIIMVFIMLFFSGCRKEQCDVASYDESKQNVTLKIIMCKSSGNIDDAKEVENAINQYIFSKIDTFVEINYVEYESLSRVVAQTIESNEQLDLFVTVSGSLMFDLYRENKLKDLKPLIEQYGEGILQFVDEKYIEATSYGGVCYGIPTLRDIASNSGLEYRADIAEKYGLEMEHIQSVSDLTEVFDNLKKRDSSIYPIANIFYNEWDSLGDNNGVLMYSAQNTEVVNLYETKEYRELLELIWEWNQEEYILDTEAYPGSNFYYFRSGEVFSSWASSKPGFITQEERSIGYPMGYTEIIPPHITTDYIQKMQWGIPENSKYPEKAMQFLNLLYSDSTLINLLTYGIEGKHYTFVDETENIIGFPEGINYSNSGYSQFMGFLCGNQFLSYVWEGDSSDIWEQIQVFNENAVLSEACGFTFNDISVQNEIVAVNAVCEKYLEGFQKGVLPIYELYDTFLDELRQAGIDIIIEEKQKQLDNWLIETSVAK